MSEINQDSAMYFEAFPGGSVVKNLPVNAGDTGSIPGSGRSPGEGNGNPLQYSCLGNSMDRGAGHTSDNAGEVRCNLQHQCKNLI